MQPGYGRWGTRTGGSKSLFPTTASLSIVPYQTDRGQPIDMTSDVACLFRCMFENAFMSQ